MIVVCRDVIGFLAHYLEGDLPVERLTAFEYHLSICEECVAYLATYQATIRLAHRSRELRADELPEELVRAILERV